MQLTDKERKQLSKIEEFIYTNNVSNDYLVKLIELAGGFLNLKTISNYAKDNGISYNGAKHFRNVTEIFNVKFIIDNE